MTASTAGLLSRTQNLVYTSDLLIRRVTGDHGPGDIGAVSDVSLEGEGPAEVADNDVAALDPARSGVVVRAGSVRSATDDREVDVLVAFCDEASRDVLGYLCLGAPDDRELPGLKLDGDPVGSCRGRTQTLRTRLRLSAHADSEVTVDAGIHDASGRHSSNPRRNEAQARSEIPILASRFPTTPQAIATGSSSSLQARSSKRSPATGTRGASSSGTTMTASPSDLSTKTVRRSSGIAT